MAALQVAALVKRSHRFVGRTCLDLHEVSPRVAALGALLLSRVHVLPGRGASEHVVDVLEPWVFAARYLLLDVVHVGARVAGEAEAVQALLDQEDVGARGAEQEHGDAEMTSALSRSLNENQVEASQDTAHRDKEMQTCAYHRRFVKHAPKALLFRQKPLLQPRHSAHVSTGADHQQSEHHQAIKGVRCKVHAQVYCCQRSNTTDMY